MNFAEQAISINNIEMIKMIIEINSKFRAAKYQRIKQVKVKISFKTFEIFDRFKKLVQMFKKQSNFVNIIKQILNTSIEIRLRELLEISSELLQQMFRDIIDEEIKAVFKKRKVIAQKKIVKEKKMHVKSVRFNSIESIHLKEIVV